MALTILSTLFLIECWQEGACFDSTLTLGKLGCFMSPRDLQRTARLFPSKCRFVESVERGTGNVDDLLSAMGANQIDAMDVSNFEGATIVHDLNEPLPARLRSQYDAVIDSGTLEHIFNVPTACRNIMDALKVGGHFFAALPANNYCGHGFYQFSAEFFYRTFSEDNGFEVRKLFVAPFYVAGKWLDGPVFEVSDPEEMRSRVEIVGNRKMMFLVQARKTAQRSPFAKWPQQSDYAVAWAQRRLSQQQHHSRRLGAAITTKIGGIRRVIERLREKRIWTRQCLRNPALRPHRWKS
jgi:SAM-dependent methyltransferase